MNIVIIILYSASKILHHKMNNDLLRNHIICHQTNSFSTLSATAHWFCNSYDFEKI